MAIRDADCIIGKADITDNVAILPCMSSIDISCSSH